MRLIDADALIKRFETIQKQEQAIGLDFVAIIDEIKEQQTAYDVDKVVKELEEKKEEVQRMKNTCVALSDLEVCDIENVTYERAIEIVKQGGVSDDVCEWRLCDEEANVYDTSCRNPHILIDGTPRENNYKFCPYCGKRIKVVE